MARDSYLSGVLADGARPFQYRVGVRELLGLPDDNGVRITFGPTPPRGGLRYRRQQDSTVPQPQSQVWDGGTRWLAETEDFEEQPAARLVPTRIDVPGVTERPPHFPSHDFSRSPDVAAFEKSAGQVPGTSVWPSESQAAQESSIRYDETPMALVIPPAIQPVRPVATPPPVGVSPARPTALPAANPMPQPMPQPVARPVPQTVAQTALSPAPRPTRALDTPQWTPTQLLPSPVPTRRSTVAPAVADIEPVRSVPTASLEGTTWSPDWSDGETTAVQSVVNANRPWPEPSVLRSAGSAVLDVPYRKPVGSVPTLVETSTPPVEQHSAPPPVPPRVVVMRAPAPVAEVPAFWERRQLGRLLNRIMR